MALKYEDLKVLLVGYGSIGRRHARILNELGVRRMALSDPSESARRDFLSDYKAGMAFDDLEKALVRFAPDAVFILSPTKHHVAGAVAALKAGAHVFVEKPLSYSHEGVAELERLSREKGLKVTVGFCLRYHEALLKAKSLLQSGAIGQLISVRANVGEPFYLIHPEYQELYYSKYSGCFELVHDVDLAIWFAGGNLVRSTGACGSYSPMNMQSPDVAELVMTFDNRTIASVHLDFFQSPRHRTLDLIGWDGAIRVEFSSWDEATISIWTKKTGKWETESVPTRRDDMFTAEDRDFLDCITQGKDVKVTVCEALKSVDAVSAVYQVDCQNGTSGRGD